MRRTWWIYLIGVLGLVAVAAPFLWMVLGSFKTQGELLQNPPTWFPQTATLDNYTQLFSRLNFKQYFFNSTVVAVCVTAGNLLFCSMLGYALAMLDFKGKKVLFGVVMGTLMIPGVVTFVPLFVLVANIGLIDSLPGLILPFLAAPFGVFLMRQFFLGLPRDLLDAGRVDGAGELRIFARIFLPLAGPALATLGILTFLASWNNFLWPYMVTNNPDLMTMPNGIATVMNSYGIQWAQLMAGGLMAGLPLIVVFVFFQRQIVAGVAHTGLAGQ